MARQPVGRLLGASLYRPWFDEVATTALTEWLFPMSRAWAAAVAAEGEVARFRQALPELGRLSSLDQIVARVHERKLQHDVAAANWRAAMFAANEPGQRELKRLERQRRLAAFRLAAERRRFLPALWAAAIPPVNWRIASLADLEARHGARLTAGADAFAPPRPMPAVARSHAIERKDLRVYWLNLPAPALSPPCWAKVYEPLAVPNPPTVVFLHGIGVEMDIWPQTRDVANMLAQQGLRVIQHEGLWHGRRCEAGWFGGEQVLATAPLGLLDYMQATVMEAAILTAWARGQGGGPVGIGGISLGALSAQKALSVAAALPAAARPDAALLIAPGGGLRRIALESALTVRIGLPQALARHGWRPSDLERWLPLVDPVAAPTLDPSRIVVAMGTVDHIAHYDDARRVIQDWGVPPGNVRLARKGHFSVSLDAAWLEPSARRLAAILRQTG
ncbi:MAG: hypothetical protein FJX68_01800 [Alphaproteobacteria bacterium]|nr:hypothetical protein [Alphaproteobacteria bacterium]